MGRYSLKIFVRNLLGEYPSLFYSLYGLKHSNRQRFTNSNTQIVIEGFPRSGNTFAVNDIYT